MPFAFAAEADCEGRILPDNFEMEWKLMFLVLSNVSLRLELLLVKGMMLAVDCVAWYICLSLGVLLLSPTLSDSPLSYG